MTSWFSSSVVECSYSSLWRSWVLVPVELQFFNSYNSSSLHKIINCCLLAIRIIDLCVKCNSKKVKKLGQELKGSFIFFVKVFGFCFFCFNPDNKMVKCLKKNVQLLHLNYTCINNKKKILNFTLNIKEFNNLHQKQQCFIKYTYMKKYL